MAKYKNIKSAIHNWAHSFLSIENYDEKGYFVSELYKAAKDQSASKITINILSGKLSPDTVETDRVKSFLTHCSESFSSQLKSQNVEPNMIKSAELVLEYDFSVPLVKLNGFSFRDPWKAPEAATYTTNIVVTDDRNIVHQSIVEEWWR